MAFFLLAAGQSVAAEAADPLAALNQHAIRSVGFDLCLPADGYEYAALGKNAVIMLTSETAIAPELPLRSVYVEVGDVRVPLQVLGRTDVSEQGGRYRQVSFYMVPIELTKRQARLIADFTGGRTGFSITNFGPDFYAEDAPAFVRLDEYGWSSEPEPAALRALLEREYPDFFTKD
ncbi:hypothetical protein [Sphingomonas sp. 35-24ZXX]|uniref:hypothetical protein n=1 Tax=Sphingomonas sp. 35-24ZXX TaxID=1545915 RepID=UPI0012E0863C|nr:hypothetical protein [Sphingomonas sp. 35-24ZXX]